MPELNFVSTSTAADPTGASGQQLQPYYSVTMPGYNYGGADNATGTGFMEFGSGAPGALPFRVDQAGNVTMASSSLSPAGGATSSPLAITGNTNAGQLVYFEQDSSTDHVLTLNLVGTGGTSQAALNAVSANSAFSCVEVSGTETNRGTVKIAHKGYANGSDSGNAGVSIDLQTTVGGATGTASQGLFVTSTTDSIPGGNAITIRYNSQDWFVVKGNVGAGNGIVGIGIATGHTPAGMLEIAQKDTTTVGLYMQALASGADLVDLKNSGGTLVWQVNNSGNMVVRANSFFTSPVIVGATTSDAGGSGSGLTLCHTTDPTTNPASGHIILYTDASGNLLARTSAGNVRTVAAV